MGSKIIGILDFVLGGLWIAHGVCAVNDAEWIAAHTDLVICGMFLLGVMYVLLGIYMMTDNRRS